MTTLKQIELESVFLISIVAAVSLFFVIQRNNQGQFNPVSTPVIAIDLPLITPAPQQQIFSQISPDGTKEVVMKIDHNQDNTKTYSFYALDIASNNEQFVFEKTHDGTKSMKIPYNTWSPDNKYFFIQENAQEGSSVFALKASGEPFSKEEQYFDVTNLFKKKETGNIFKEATGWASETLILITTTKEDNTEGPSYWFEVPSKAIIQLSTKF